jgi:transketolase
MLSDTERERLTEHAKAIRRLIIDAIHAVGTGHAGSSLSMVEILTFLYFHHLKVRAQDPHWPERDYLVLSKGHGSPGLYAALAEAGFLPKQEMLTLRCLGTRLQGHPNANDLPGVDVSTGSLGQGISNAVGLALGFKHQSRQNRVYCILGDGELQEGQNWEAFMSASHFGLANLTAILDRNRLQGDGDTEIVMALGDIAAKLRAFGWLVHEIDGHDFAALDQALTAPHDAIEKPKFIVAHTIKGRGVSYMENVMEWHHHPIDDQQYRIAIDDIERGIR